MDGAEFFHLMQRKHPGRELTGLSAHVSSHMIGPSAALQH